MKNVMRILAVLLVACMLLAMPVYAVDEITDTTGAGNTATTAPEEGEGEAEDEGVSASLLSYIEYYEKYSGKDKPQTPVVVGVENVIATENAEKSATTQENVAGTLLNKDNGWIEWQVEIPESGIYNLTTEYYPLADSGRSISLKVTIDGAAPYVEAQTLALPRIWKDAGDPVVDELGNHIRPSQVEAPHWTSFAFVNELGMYTDPYFFYFEAGTHTVRFERVRESLAISKLTLSNAKTLPSYEEYVASKGTTKPTGEVIKQEAEKPLEKSDSTLYALMDHQDAGTTPNHPTAMLLNTIGGSNWSTTGQSITWTVPEGVTEAGWYTLALRARQNANQGMKSYRNLSINGEIPFAEAVNLEFEYDSDWKVYALPQLWLEPGDKITLTVSSGELSDVLRTVQESVLALNDIYRKIIVITGTSPDVYQDYYLEDEIPGLKEMFLEQKEKMIAIANKIVEVNGKTGSQTSMLMETAEKLDVYSGKSYEITADLGSFKSSIESLSSLLLSFGQQPVEIDCLYYVPDGVEVPDGKAGFWTSMVYSVKKFIGSFFNDYQVKGEVGTVDAWVSTGRDQMQIISSMITDFTAQEHVKVRLSLVDTGTTLLSATMAGKGPDIALLIPSTEIINLSMRGALVDLDAEYGLFEQMGDHFTEAAWKHFRYNDGDGWGIYAIPETQSWPMAFYRTDIFEELDLEVPKTWNELYEMLRTLQGQNMNIGMVETSSGTPGVSGSIDIFQSILFQKGSTYYNEDLTATLFDTTPAYEAFEQWSEFYSKYGVDRSIDFYNRFRTGDVPYGIITYGTYNQLMAAAPELRGLWKMAPIPGTVLEDGSIRHDSASGGSGCMMLTAAQKRGVADAGYKFLTWWTDHEQQVRYGNELEATMGVAARYTPADIEALDKMGWTDEELAVLKDQRDHTQNVYSIPGDYLLARSLTNALRSTLDGDLEPRRTLSQYNRDINAEITRKRKEFGLDKK
ncbi:MAG: extracellular solute-binding protein [Clostridia bacterium]|nr:extracellular solute-binding protein [Clostridia bacterium]